MGEWIGSFVKYYEFEGLQPEQYVTKGLEHVFQYDHDFRSCLNQRKPEFYEYFQKALDNYIDGDWLNAASNLIVAGQLVKDDGPSAWMAAHIDKYKSLPPEDWSGVRNIDQKDKAPQL